MPRDATVPDFPAIEVSPDAVLTPITLATEPISAAQSMPPLALPARSLYLDANW